MANSIRIAVVDDHPLFREGVVASLKSNKAIQIVGQGDCAEAAIAICEKTQPDILLLDIMMPGGCAIEATRKIVTEICGTKIVILTASENEAHVSSALAAGAKGYVLKGVNSSELVRAVTSIHSGSTYVAPGLAAQLLTKMNRRLQADPTPDTTSLSPREDDILDRVSQGLTNKEVARSLSISEKTVKHYMTNIMQKLQVRNRVEAVLAARARRAASAGRPGDGQRARKQAGRI